MSIPIGIPLLYRLDKDMKPVEPQMELEFRFMVEPKGYTWGTLLEHGFHGVYLGDLERLQEIQRKRDDTNRSWQRIILRNIGKSLGWDMSTHSNIDSKVIETRQLWWQVHSKMQEPEYGNMLLLAKVEDYLEDLMSGRRQRYMTKSAYSKLIDKIHLDTKGSVVEPFCALAERKDRAERQRIWYQKMAIDHEDRVTVLRS